MNDNPRYTYLMSRFIENEMTVEETDELLHMLEADPGLLDAAAREALVAGMLAGVRQDSEFTGRVMARVAAEENPAGRAALRPWRRFVLAAAAMLLVCTGLVWMFRSAPPAVSPGRTSVSTVVAVKGDLLAAGGNSLRPGDQLLSSERLTTSANGYAKLKLLSGAWIEADSNTALIVAGPDTVRLEHGRLYCDAAGRTVTISMPAGGSTVSTAATAAGVEVRAGGGEVPPMILVGHGSVYASIDGAPGRTVWATNAVSFAGKRLTVAPVTAGEIAPWRPHDGEPVIPPDPEVRKDAEKPDEAGEVLLADDFSAGFEKWRILASDAAKRADTPDVGGFIKATEKEAPGGRLPCMLLNGAPEYDGGPYVYLATKQPLMLDTGIVVQLDMLLEEIPDTEDKPAGDAFAMLLCNYSGKGLYSERGREANGAQKSPYLPFKSIRIPARGKWIRCTVELVQTDAVKAAGEWTETATGCYRTQFALPEDWKNLECLWAIANRCGAGSRLYITNLSIRDKSPRTL